MANDPKSFAEAYCRAVRDWATANPCVTLLDIANEMDAAADAEAKAWFEAHPETTLANLSKPTS
jgi:hypothetical protein